MPTIPPPLTTPFGAIAAVATVATAAVGAVALYNRSTPGAAWLAATLFADAVVAAFALGGYAVPGAYRVEVALAVGGLGLLAAVPFVAFVVAYTGRGRHLTYWSLLGYGGPLFVAAALYATGQYHGLMLSGEVGVRRAAGLTLLTFGGLTPLLGATLLYVGLLLFGTLLLALQTVVRHDRMYLGQSAALFVVALAPVAAVVPAVGGFGGVPGLTPARSVAVAAGLMVVVAVAVAVAAGRYRLFEFVPAVRQFGDRAAIDDLDEGIIIVDDGGNVARLNDAAARTLGTPREEAVGSSVAALFGAVGVDDPMAVPATFEHHDGTYEVTCSPITDGRERLVGRTFVVRDVTRRELRKQRLQVLNRVLRHNVRNDMSVIKMHAGTVAEEGNRRLSDLGENMSDIADELVEIGEKVRRTEEVLSAEELERQDVEILPFVEQLLDGVEATSEVMTVDSMVTAGGVDSVRTNSSLLELTLENVIENAVEHNGADVPKVGVAVDRVGDGVRVTVADDGPGIPESELTALESGRETDLEHASSLGLWLVVWGVDRLGGDLAIEHLAPSGTAVAVWLPDVPEVGPDGADVDALTAPGPPEDLGVADEAVGHVADGVAEDGAVDASPGDVAGTATGSTAVDGGASGGSTPVRRPPRRPPASPNPSGDDGEAGDDEAGGEEAGAEETATPAETGSDGPGEQSPTGEGDQDEDTDPPTPPGAPPDDNPSTPPGAPPDDNPPTPPGAAPEEDPGSGDANGADGDGEGDDSGGASD